MREGRHSKKLTPAIAAHRVALDEYPEFAAEVGILMSCFALIESYMHQLISRTTGIGESDTFLIAGSHLTFGPRIDLLETLLKKPGLVETVEGDFLPVDLMKKFEGVGGDAGEVELDEATGEAT